MASAITKWCAYTVCTVDDLRRYKVLTPTQHYLIKDRSIDSYCCCDGSRMVWNGVSSVKRITVKEVVVNMRPLNLDILVDEQSLSRVLLVFTASVYIITSLRNSLQHHINRLKISIGKFIENFAVRSELSCKWLLITDSFILRFQSCCWWYLYHQTSCCLCS